MPGVILSQLEMHTSVRAVRVDHVLHGVRNDVAGGQRVEHPVVAHGDTVVHGNRVEFLGHAAGFLDRGGHQVAHVLEVDVPGDELGEGVGDRDDRLTEVLAPHAGGPPQARAPAMFRPVVDVADRSCGTVTPSKVCFGLSHGSIVP